METFFLTHPFREVLNQQDKFYQCLSYSRVYKDQFINFIIMHSKIDNEKFKNQLSDIFSLTKELAATSQKQNRIFKQLQQESTGNNQKKKQLNYELDCMKSERKELCKKFVTHLTNIQQNAQTLLTPFLIYLIATQIFHKIVNVVVDMQKQWNFLAEGEYDYDDFFQDKQKAINEVENLFLKFMQTSFKVSPKLFDTFCEEQMKNIRQAFILEKVDHENIEGKEKDIEFEQILNLLTEIYQQDKKDHNLLNYVHERIIKYESVRKSDDLLKEISINWIKYQLDESRREKQYLCCKNNFFQNENFEYVKRKLYSFKPFQFSKIQSYVSNQKEKYRQKETEKKKISEDQEQLSRTITALMNQKGGVIFLGIIVEEQSKICSVVGFEFEDKNKKQLLMYIKRIVNEILPKHKGFEELDEFNTPAFLGSFYEINYYISVELINIVKKQTFQSCKGKPYYKKYICKIIVKMGHPRYLYYVLKNEGNTQDKKQAQIQFYIRSQQGNERQMIQKSYDTIYKKLINYETIKQTGKVNDRQQLHEGCRYNMSLKSEHLILDIQGSSDEDN